MPIVQHDGVAPDESRPRRSVIDVAMDVVEESTWTEEMERELAAALRTDDVMSPSAPVEEAVREDTVRWQCMIDLWRCVCCCKSI